MKQPPTLGFLALRPYIHLHKTQPGPETLMQASDFPGLSPPGHLAFVPELHPNSQRREGNHAASGDECPPAPPRADAAGQPSLRAALLGDTGHT